MQPLTADQSSRQEPGSPFDSFGIRSRFDAAENSLWCVLVCVFDAARRKTMCTACYVQPFSCLRPATLNLEPTPALADGHGMLQTLPASGYLFHLMLLATRAFRSTRKLLAVCRNTCPNLSHCLYNIASAPPVSARVSPLARCTHRGTFEYLAR